MKNEFLNKDPFPEIEPALLNSADIEDYVNTTQMIVPFNPEKLKSASYEVEFDGVIYYWDEKGDPHAVSTDDQSQFKLKKNSIAFLFTKVKFTLPDYIALRFNLKITHVHRGLLLGTGPLIDPGFEGSLLIPLHNLTTNDYILKKDEGIIWVEFTKLSRNPLWDTTTSIQDVRRKGKYKPFLEDKKNQKASYYFGKAAMGKAIRSSLPEVISKTAEDANSARNDANIAKNRAEKLETRSYRFAWASFAAIIVGAIGVIITIYVGFQPILQMVQDTTEYMKTQETKSADNFTTLNDKLKELNTKINYLESKLDGIPEKNLNALDHSEAVKNHLIERKISK